jgi:hypothetical protein
MLPVEVTQRAITFGRSGNAASRPWPFFDPRGE